MTAITVLFSTYNGEAVLRDTLNGYCALLPTPFDWQMIVVDNGSTDSTFSILKDYQQLLPIQIITQNAPGKNRALNMAIPHISGDFVVITDDDAIPQHGFLQSWVDTFMTQSTYDLFGGTIIPHFQSPPPEWMIKSQFHFEEIYAARCLPSGPVEATAIFGPNMAVRKTIFSEGLIFNEDIGPNGNNKNYPMGSEAGHKAYFAAGPAVRHIVRPHQIVTAYWISRAYKHGLGAGLQYRLRYPNHSKVKHVVRSIKHVLRQGYELIKRCCARHPLTKNMAIWNYHWNRGFHQGRA
jgi:glycosyltransferase involved in cell wall biosynthesis